MLSSPTERQPDQSEAKIKKQIDRVIYSVNPTGGIVTKSVDLNTQHRMR